MYTIGEISKMTGISAFTLRYYEKIGVLPEPKRGSNGIRRYDEEDLRFIRFVDGLKQTGMKLQDIAAFAQDGCLLSKQPTDPGINRMLHKRIDLLSRHLEHLDQQIRRLEEVKAVAHEKNAYYVKLSGRPEP
ncbi:MerR family transcriptional regulator [Paenibacillus thermotolerans]|uniref:MerR family transcriptional regulator n=1 Tax=Paenibacillus thermotolerans TaxID=3027807 RepID=UPI00236832AF|nr:MULTISPECIES: MerR family transcriptional regulator [unclassified Paenibacillus]